MSTNETGKSGAWKPPRPTVDMEGCSTCEYEDVNSHLCRATECTHSKFKYAGNKSYWEPKVTSNRDTDAKTP